MTMRAQEEQYLSEIIKFYRDKQIIFSVEDCMNDKRDRKKYKIMLKLIPLTEDNKSHKDRVLQHFLDVHEAKRICYHILEKGSLNGLYNAKEQIQNQSIEAFKDIKGSVVNNEIQSRILTVFEHQQTCLIQLSVHPGRKTNLGAVMPIGKAINKLYIKFSRKELEQFAIELRDYIFYKELVQFKMFHNVALLPIRNSI